MSDRRGGDVVPEGAGGARRRWPALAVGLVAAFMTLLDVSIVNVAIPSIERALHATPSDLQWVLSGYALTFGLVLVPAGRFGDIHGRRNLFVAGLSLFTVTSAAAGLAGSPTTLVVARLLQGAAAGVVNPQVAGLIQQLFRPSERGRPFGLLGATIGISTAIGPLLGGVLIDANGSADGWRWVFYVNVPVGVVAVLLGWRLIPGATSARPQGHRLDPIGVALLGVGVLAVLLPLIQRQQWPGWHRWLLLSVGLAALGAFAAWEHRYRRAGSPLFDLGLFRRRSYALGTLIGLLYFAGFTAIFFVYTLYLQNGLGYGPLSAGLAITPFALGSAVASAVGGQVVHRYGRPLVAAGLILVAVGLVAVTVVVHRHPGAGMAWVNAGPLLVAGLGSGLVITPNQTLTLAEVPVPQAGSAAGMLQTGQRIGSAAGIAAVGAVFFGTLSRTGGNWSLAFRDAVLLATVVVLVALVAAGVDVVAAHRRRRSTG